MRTTRQRRAVAAVIDGLDTFTSTQGVHELLQAGGSQIGLSTVYRSLQSMAELGQIDSVRDPDGEVLYRSCGQYHHHHLVCRSCGAAEELPAAAVERWVNRAASEHGYVDVTHEVEVFGVCPSCA